MLEFSKNHKFFNQLTMVCKCVPNDATRYALNCVLVDDQYIVATDGRRLARLDNFGIDEGRYAVMKCTKQLIILVKSDIEGNYPDYKQVIPDMPREDEKQIITGCRANLPKPKVADLTKLAYNLAQKGVAVYLDYLANFQDCDSFYVIGKERPVMFFDTCFVGIIMPFDCE